MAERKACRSPESLKVEKKIIKRDKISDGIAKQYKKDQIKGTKTVERIFQLPDGKTKTKTIELTTYKNGVTKSRIVNVVKK